MKIVLDYYNIPKENCVAIGDSSNDLDMLKFSGISIAMGNATDYVKTKSDFITLPIEEDGVSYAIEHILKNATKFSVKTIDSLYCNFNQKFLFLLLKRF